MPSLNHSRSVSGTALKCTSWRLSNQIPGGNARCWLTIRVCGPRQELSRDSPKVVLLHVVPKRPEAHTQKFRGLHLYTARPLERFREIPPLDVLDVRFKVE